MRLRSGRLTINNTSTFVPVHTLKIIIPKDIPIEEENILQDTINKKNFEKYILECMSDFEKVKCKYKLPDNFNSYDYYTEQAMIILRMYEKLNTHFDDLHNWKYHNFLRVTYKKTFSFIRDLSNAINHGVTSKGEKIKGNLCKCGKERIQEVIKYVIKYAVKDLKSRIN
jgi:hypothetical protein